MAKVIHQLFAIVNDHLRLRHPDRNQNYTREHVRRLASRLVSPAVQGAP